MKTIEEWAAEKGTEPWKLAGAKVREKGWGEGKQVDEAAFDAAISAVDGIKLYAYAPPAPALTLVKPGPEKRVDTAAPAPAPEPTFDSDRSKKR